MSSSGTNGYGHSHMYQACMVAVAPPNGSTLKKVRNPGSAELGLLDLWVMASVFDQLKPRIWNERRKGPAIVRRHETVARAPEHQRWIPDSRQPMLQFRIMQIGCPSVET